MTFSCAESSEKKIRLKHQISRTEKCCVVDILQIQENWVGRNFITNSCVCIHCSLRKQKCRLKSTTTNGWRRFWPSGTAQIIVFYPIRKESTFWLFCMWSGKEMYHALLPKTDYREKGRGHDHRLPSTRWRRRQVMKSSEITTEHWSVHATITPCVVFNRGPDTWVPMTVVACQAQPPMTTSAKINTVQ